MALLPMPKVPKVSDLLPQLTAFDERISALEAYVARNDQRITNIEQWGARALAARDERIVELEHAIDEHQAGAVARQREVNRLKRDAEVTRWRLRKRRM